MGVNFECCNTPSLWRYGACVHASAFGCQNQERAAHAAHLDSRDPSGGADVCLLDQLARAHVAQLQRRLRHVPGERHFRRILLVPPATHTTAPPAPHTRSLCLQLDSLTATPTNPCPRRDTLVTRPRPRFVGSCMLNGTSRQARRARAAAGTRVRPSGRTRWQQRSASCATSSPPTRRMSPPSSQTWMWCLSGRLGCCGSTSARG